MESCWQKSVRNGQTGKIFNRSSHQDLGVAWVKGANKEQARQLASRLRFVLLEVMGFPATEIRGRKSKTTQLGGGQGAEMTLTLGSVRPKGGP